jgi:hypothetical protein
LISPCFPSTVNRPIKREASSVVGNDWLLLGFARYISSVLNARKQSVRFGSSDLTSGRLFHRPSDRGRSEPKFRDPTRNFSANPRHAIQEA